MINEQDIAEYAKKEEMNIEDLLEFLLDTSEAMAAQALVVSMRDELKFGKAI